MTASRSTRKGDDKQIDYRIEPVDFNSTPGQMFISLPEVVFSVVNHGDADETGMTFEITLERRGI
ncbi:MAG: hypothetical protein JXR76_05375 [Deltaproteobacteria bacterium]|nr:hypothetical protein [Deltaproteobacteria bacterium]